VSDEARIQVQHDSDVVAARQKGRELAGKIGFSGSDLTLIATAISEVARNIVTYAGRGEIIFTFIENGERRGIAIVARDDGPGIADIEMAMRDGHSTGGSLGLGLPGARRLVDEFEIASEVGRGTTVKLRKWVRR